MSFDLHLWPLTSWTCEGSYNISINQVWFQLDFNFSNSVNFTVWPPSYNLTSDDLLHWYMTFDCMNIQRGPYCINKPRLIQIGLQHFKWGHFHIFSLSYNLTSDDLRPWCDLWPHQQMLVPMLYLWPNFGWNPSKHVGRPNLRSCCRERSCIVVLRFCFILCHFAFSVRCCSKQFYWVLL